MTSATGSVDVPVSPKRIVVLWKPTLAAAVALGFTPLGTIAQPTGPDQDLEPYLPAGFDRKKLTIVSNSSGDSDINIERVISLKPDLIIGAATANGKSSAVATKLKAAAPVVLLPWTGNGSWRRHLTDVAGVLGVPAKASTIAANYRKRVDATRTAIGVAGQKPVSLLRVQGRSEFRLETPASFAGSIVADVGLPRPAAQIQPDAGKDFKVINAERLQDADGDRIFVLANTGKGGTVAVLTGSPLWHRLGGAKRAYQVDFRFWNGTSYYSADRVLTDLAGAYAGTLKPL